MKPTAAELRDRGRRIAETTRMIRERDDPAIKALGQNLRRLRRRAGLNQGEAAALVGVTYTALHKWEVGERSPTGLSLWRIARVYRATIEELFEGVADPLG